MPMDEPQACKQHEKKCFSDDYQRANYLLRKLGSVFEFLKYNFSSTIAIICCDLTSAADFAEEPEEAR